MARQRSVDLWFLLLQIFLDAVLLTLSFSCAFFIRFHSRFFSVTLGIPDFGSYARVFPAATFVLLLVFKSMGLYAKKELGKKIQTFQMIKAASLGMFVLMSMSFIYREVSYSRLLLLIAWFLSISWIVLERFFLERLRNRVYLSLRLHKNFLILGTGECAEKIIKNLSNLSPGLHKITGVLTNEESLSEKQNFHLADWPLLGSLNQLSEILASQKIDEVILAIPGLEHQKVVEIILACEKEMVNFRMVPDIFEILTTQVELENFCGVTLLGLKQFPLEKSLNRFYKRSVDIAGSGFGLIFLVPFFAFLSWMIKKDSRGPVFFEQERVGEDGKRFMMIKFRTMVQNAEDTTGPVWTQQDDPRRTKIGHFLRRFNLDELPQLWNVLKGDMSLVGPRPERPHFVNEFKDRVPHYMSRHKIKSGMTGWAQVNGLRGNTSVLERVKHDLYYLENWSIGLDLKIILRTFLTRKNAY